MASPFKGLEDRFISKQNELYNKYSARDGSKTGEPYIEKRPNDSSNNQIAASRINYGPAVALDLKRLTAFSKSSRGLQWLLSQQNLQAGNTFGQTRIINPAFVLGNVLPTIHLRRPLSTPASGDVKGDQTLISPASDVRTGQAGRLQKETSLSIVSSVATGKGGVLKDILKLLPPTQIITTIAGASQLLNGGSLGINQRPELDINNDNQFNSYYSIALWQGFVKTNNSTKAKIEKAVNSFRNGDIAGGITNLAGTAKDAVDTIINSGRELFGGRKNPVRLIGSLNNNAYARSLDNSSMNGRRYFITNATKADRYLADSIEFMDQTPMSSISYLNKKPYVLSGDTIITLPETPTTVLTNTLNPQQSLTKVQNSISNTLRDLNRVVLRGSQFLNTGIIPTTILKVDLEDQLRKIAKSTTGDDSVDNVAEENMLFPQLSMRNRFETDTRIDYIKTQFELDKQKWKQSLQKNNTGFIGGWQAGDDIIIDPKAKIKYPGGTYFSDAMNIQAFLTETGNELTQTTIDQMRQTASPLIDLYFFDFVNRRAVPFRAFINGFSEAVTPEFDDSTRYIGRIEKNVVYSGVNRECNFALHIHAFTDQELLVIWQKINYLTGLCYPSQYSGGFMVPPLIKLTLGDIYNNQPGYISSLNYSYEDDVSWEITPGIQAPHGVVVNISFKLLEKKQMQTDSSFYNFGLPRSTGAERRRSSLLSETELEQANASAQSARIVNQVNGQGTSTSPTILQGTQQQTRESLNSVATNLGSFGGF